MFDPKKYDTRMPDPEGKRKKPSGKEAHRHLPKEASLRKRPDTRYDEKRAEESLPPRENKPRPPAEPTRPHQTAPSAAPHTRPRRPKKFAPRSAHSPGPPAPASRRTRRGGGSSSTGQLSGCGLIMLASTIVSLGGGLIKSCRPDRAQPAVHRVSRPERPEFEFPTRPPSTPHPSILRWTSQLPPAAPDRISGAVLFGDERTVPHVRISMTADDSPTRWGRADAHGVFGFDGIDAPRAVLQVQGLMHLDTGQPAYKSFAVGTRAAPLTIHPDFALILLVDRHAGWRGAAQATVRVASTSGTRRDDGSWSLRHEVALVTGLAMRELYDVLVQAPDGELASLAERVAPGQQVLLTATPSAAVFGRVRLPVGTSTDDVDVVLTHGQLRVPAPLSADGVWRAPCLPQDSWWDVHARRQRPNGELVSLDTQHGVHAGSGRWIVLDLR